jgi:hypothetical protein
MISLLSGAILLSAVTILFRRLLPQDGVPHRLAVMPYLQQLIPIGITSGLVVGVGLIVSGLVSLNPF